MSALRIMVENLKVSLYPILDYPLRESLLTLIQEEFTLDLPALIEAVWS